MKILVNTRILQDELTGLRRYAYELFSRFGEKVARVDTPVNGGRLLSHVAKAVPEDTEEQATR